MELAVDEFIFYFLMSENTDERLTVNTLLYHVKKGPHKLVFDKEYFAHIRRRIKEVRKKNPTVFHYFDRLLNDLIFDSYCTRICESVSVSELTRIADATDRLVVKSALCISSQTKTMITTDEPLSQICRTDFGKYGIDPIDPETALSRLIIGS